MISDEDLKSLREAFAKTTPTWKLGDTESQILGPEGSPIAQFFGMGCVHRNELPCNRTFAALAHNLLPDLLARLEFAERCLTDLHDETATAETVVRHRKALEKIAKYGRRNLPEGAIINQLDHAGELARATIQSKEPTHA